MQKNATFLVDGVSSKKIVNELSKSCDDLSFHPKNISKTDYGFQLRGKAGWKLLTNHAKGILREFVEGGR